MPTSVSLLPAVLVLALLYLLEYGNTYTTHVRPPAFPGNNRKSLNARVRRVLALSTYWLYGPRPLSSRNAHLARIASNF